ncbi:u4/u6 small nuclear ribonucleoprotein prp4 [Anaeramoeba flamelloides]|uniref:U4/u6 small nuclear ribonucleoprotein prp4 n=1 Tax=Anaeramoeba flamelloides TaxID=1746091 RepID=A0ABQ8X2I4_9EUKA|nr:u4/u6 small nuclear ribonucleoprotein prp4 [Anaeramoeba flamelloides]
MIRKLKPIYKFKRKTALKDSHITKLVYREKEPYQLYTATSDGSVQLWLDDQEETFSKEPIKSYELHTDYIEELVYSESYFLTCSRDNSLKLVNPESGDPVTFLGHTDDVLSCDISEKHKRIISTGKDKTIRIWDLEGNLVHTLDKQTHSKQINEIKYIPLENERMATCSNDHKIKIWDIESNVCISELTSHQNPVTVSEPSPDGSLLTSCDSLGVISLYDLRSSSLLTTFNVESECYQIQYNPVKFEISMLTANGILNLNLEKKKFIGSMQCNGNNISVISPDTMVTTFDYLYEGSSIFTGSANGKIKQYTLKN